MRIALSVILAGFIGLAASAALAGNATLANGQVTWQSTQCPAPQMPAALAALNPETPADDVNALAAQHNAYAEQAQTYMNCLSGEAQADAETASKGIVASAQMLIQQTQAQVDRSAAALKQQ